MQGVKNQGLNLGFRPPRYSDKIVLVFEDVFALNKVNY